MKVGDCVRFNREWSQGSKVVFAGSEGVVIEDVGCRLPVGAVLVKIDENQGMMSGCAVAAYSNTLYRYG